MNLILYCFYISGKLYNKRPRVDSKGVQGLVGRLYPLKFIMSRSIADISVGKLVGVCVCGGGSVTMTNCG